MTEPHPNAKWRQAATPNELRQVASLTTQINLLRRMRTNLTRRIDWRRMKTERRRGGDA